MRKSSLRKPAAAAAAAAMLLASVWTGPAVSPVLPVWAEEDTVDQSAPEIAVPGSFSVNAGEIFTLRSYRAGARNNMGVTAMDDTGVIRLSISRIVLNGQEQPVSGGISYVFPEAGNAEVYIAAQDAAGNVGEAVAAVTVNPAPTAESILAAMNEKLAAAGSFVGNTDFMVDFRETAEDGSTVERSTSLQTMVEAVNSENVVHTSGILSSANGSMGFEKFVAPASEGNVKILNSENGVWSNREATYAETALAGMQDFGRLISVPSYTLKEGPVKKDGEWVYLLEGDLTGASLGEFLGRADVGAALPNPEEEMDAKVELVVSADTGLPIEAVMSGSRADAESGVTGLNYSIFFNHFDTVQTLSATVEQIEKAAAGTEEKKEEEKKEEEKKEEETKAAEETKSAEEKQEEAAPQSTYSGGTYVEVDLTNQQVYLYVDGACIMTSPCVTGKVSAGMGTPGGTYYVSYMQRGAYLMGNAYVDYWMPFNGGIGLHDASWRYGNFDYLEAWNNGSHGCVNMPSWAAATCFEYLHPGDRVTVYGWPQDPATAHRHTAGDWEVVKAATCTEEGQRVKKCVDDGEVMETETIPKTAHTDGEWKVTKAATETAEGEKTLYCKNCNAVIRTEVIAKAGHDWGEWQTSIEAKCETAGQEKRVCKNDASHVETREIPALGHDWKATTTTIEHPAVEGVYEVRTVKEAVTEQREKTTIQSVYVIDVPAKAAVTEEREVTPAYTETITQYTTSDEQTFSTVEEADAYVAAHEGVTYSDTSYTVDHEAVMETVEIEPAVEEQGHYEDQEVGTGEYETVEIEPAVTETVTITEPVAAWTETVTTYTCSRCGATK